jgi:hypothetical protein
VVTKTTGAHCLLRKKHEEVNNDNTENVCYIESPEEFTAYEKDITLALVEKCIHVFCFCFIDNVSRRRM